MLFIENYLDPIIIMYYATCFKYAMHECLIGEVVFNLTKFALPSIRTGVKDTETLVQNTECLVCVCWVVIGIVALTHSETSLEI